MPLEIDPQRRTDLVEDLQALFRDDFDIELSDFRAEQVVELTIKLVGPSIYNQAVQDTRKHLQKKLDDLEAEVEIA